MNRVVLRNVLFQNNKARFDGAGFYAYYDNTGIDLFDCVFINNYAGVNGGGLGLHQNNLRLTMTNCLFENNVAEGEGGAAKTGANEYFVVIGCTFKNNTALTMDGGAINFGIDNRVALISDSVFIGNKAAVDGGAIFFGANNHYFTIGNNTFISNSAGNYGGALSLRSNNNNGRIRSCIFKRNTAGAAGGAIHSALRNSDADMTDLVFEFNSGMSYAGGIYFGNDHNNVTVSGGKLLGNFAHAGAGIFVSQFNTNFFITRLVFEKNYAKNSGAGMIMNANFVNIRHCVFLRNSADMDVGGLLVGEASLGNVDGLTISNCSFIENSGQNNHGGLQIGNRNGVEVSDCLISHNHAKTGSGGGVSLYFCTDVTISTTTVVGNDCLLGGAGINLVGIQNITLFNSTLKSNRATRGAGGGMRSQVTADLFISNVHVIQNYAYTEGGGMHMSGVQLPTINVRSSVLLEDSTVHENIAAEGSGSAFWVSKCRVKLRRNDFGWNRAPKGGGTLFWMYSSGMSEPESSGNVWSVTNYGLYGSKWATEGTHLNVYRNEKILNLENPLNVTSYDDEIPRFYVAIADYYEQLIVTNNQTTVDVAVPSNSICTDYQQRQNLSAYVAGGLLEMIFKT